jgi:hypothetical protein
MIARLHHGVSFYTRLSGRARSWAIQETIRDNHTVSDLRLGIDLWSVHSRPTGQGLVTSKARLRRELLSPPSFAHAITCAYLSPCRQSIIGTATLIMHRVLPHNAPPREPPQAPSLVGHVIPDSDKHRLLDSPTAYVFGSRIGGVGGRAHGVQFLRPARQLPETRCSRESLAKSDQS